MHACRSTLEDPTALADADLTRAAELELGEPPWGGSTLAYRLVGHGSGQVRLTGTTPSPVLHAEVAAPAVVLEGPPDDDGPGVPFSAARGTLDYASGRFRWEVRASGPPAVEAAGEVRLAEGAGAPAHTIALDATGWDAARLARLVRAPLDAAGTADLRMRLEVGRAGMSGDLTGAFRGRLFGVDVDVREARLAIDPTRVRLAGLSATIAGSRVRASGDLPAAGAGAGTGLELAVDSLDLANLALARERGIRGTVSGTGRISGTAAAPVLEAEASLRDVAFGRTLLGDLEGTLHGEHGAVALALHRPDLDLDARASLEGARAFTLEATLRETPLQPLEALLLPPAAEDSAAARPLLVGGTLSGTLSATGTLAPLAIAEGRLAVSQAHATLGSLEVAAAAPFEMRIDPSARLELLGLKLDGPQTALRVEGSIGLGGNPSDLRLDGSTDLRILRAFVPDVTVSGPLELDLYLRGSLAAPHITGRASLAEGYFRSPALPYPLRDATGEVEFAGATARVPRLTARFGGGRIQAEGTIDVTDLRAPKLRLHATGEDVRLTLLDDLDVRADPDLTYEVTGEGRSITGTLHVTRATYTARGGLEATGVGRPRGIAAGGGESSLGAADTRLSLTVTADSNLWLLASDARIQADAALTIGGTAGEPVVLGRVSYLSQERLELQGRSYRIARGTLVFDNPSEIDPRLDVLVETELQGIDVTLQITGPLSSPAVTARSDPPLPQSDVFSLLIGGTVRESGEGGVAGPSSDEVLRSLFLPRAIARLTGGYFTVDVSALRGKADPTEVLPIALRPADKIDVTLGLPLREARTGLVVLNWRPFGNVSFSAIRDLDRALGLETGWEKRFGHTGATKQREPRVLSVRLLGAPQALEARLLDRVKTEPGDRLSPDRLRSDVDRLTAELRDRGYPLAHVSARVEQAGHEVERASGKDTAKAGDTPRVRPLPLPSPGAPAPGAGDASPAGAVPGLGARVVFQVELGTPVELALAGPQVDKHLQSRLAETVQSFGLYGETTAELERTTRAALEEKGYPRSVVSCERADTEAVRIACDIDPGVRYHVGEIDIEGNEHVSRDACVAVLRTRKGMFHPARLVTARVEDDVEALRGVFVERGYLAATARAEVLEGGSPDSLHLVFHVEEGELRRVGEIQIHGALAVPEKELRSAMHVESGDGLEEAKVRADRDAVFRVYDRQGYMDARVRVEQHERGPSSPALVDLDFRVTEGPLVRVRAIRIEGADRTRESVIRHALHLHVGAVMGYGRVSSSQRALYDLGIFRSVDIASEPVKDEPGLRDVVIRVEEASPYRVQVGAGLDSKQGVRGLLELADSNLTGRARYLGLQLRAAGDSSRAQVLFREPHPLGLDLPSFLTTFYERRHEVSFDLARTAFRAEATKALGRRSKSRALFRYSLSDTRLSQLRVSTLEAGAENVRLSSLGLALIRDTRDDVLEPRRGTLASADVEWADTVLGSQASFTKLTLKGYRFQRLGAKLVWASAAQVGLGFPVRDPGASLPLAERYFSGGATSLRGFGYNEAGPRDPETNRPTGGNAVVVLNEELRRDLFRRIVGSVFVDAGNVYDDVSDLGSLDLRWSAGVGLRYRGPIVAGIDYARLLGAKAGEKPYQIHFSLGYAF